MMMTELNETIERFVGHFRDQRLKIAALGTERDHIFFKKTLYVAALDALARSAYPQIKGNKERFVKFIGQFGSWNDANRVSLPHLAALMSKAPDPAYSRVREYTLAELTKWGEGQEVPLSRDPPYDTIHKMWPSEKGAPSPLVKVSLKSLQHIYLLYTFRSSAVHELRGLGYGVEIDNDKEPYYLSCTTSFEPEDTASNSGVKAWELTYPLRFFEMLFDRSLIQLEEHLKKDRLNPYTSFRFGTYWIPELN
ncbi:MAG: hypothetical protein IV108_07720 [Burkholderiales bacterium]|nr:hypothetical protein [Burkholderiales bacterium]